MRKIIACLGVAFPLLSHAVADVGQYTAMKLDSFGDPIISYYDVTNANLKVALCGNSSCSSGNTLNSPDTTGNVGQFTAIVKDGTGLPIISYYDVTNGDLKVTHCGNTACSSGNTTNTVDSTGNVGQYTAMVLDGTGLPVISYYDGSHLKVAHCGNVSCSSGNTLTTVDSGTNVGQYTAIILDNTGLPIISYYDVSGGNLKVVACGNTSCSSGNTISSPDTTNNVGQYTSIVLNQSFVPVISYYDVTNGDLRVIQCGNTACSSGNTITSVDTTGNVGEFTSIALDSSGLPMISYYDVTNGNLKMAHCGNSSCSSGNTLSTLDSTGDVGRYTWIIRDQLGLPIISYYDVTNGNLKVLHCGNTSCTSGNSINTVDS